MQPSANIHLFLPVIDPQPLKAHHRWKLLLDSMKCLCLRNFKNHISLRCRVPKRSHQEDETSITLSEQLTQGGLYSQKTCPSLSCPISWCFCSMECVKPPASCLSRYMALWLEACGSLWLCRWNTSPCYSVLCANFIQSCVLTRPSFSTDFYSHALSNTKVDIWYQVETSKWALHCSDTSLPVIETTWSTHTNSQKVQEISIMKYKLIVKCNLIVGMVRKNPLSHMTRAL